MLVRPSYVLGGRGMEIVYDDAQLRKYVDRALREAQADTVVSGRLPSPLLIDKFLQDAVEIDVDALFDGEEPVSYTHLDVYKRHLLNSSSVRDVRQSRRSPRLWP